MNSTCFIVNPRSAGGATGRRFERLATAIRERFPGATLWHTEAPGHASELARRAREEGFGHVVAVGGDGTASEVVHGLCEDGPTEVAFSILPAGTGSDLVRTLQMPSEMVPALDAIRLRQPRPVDVIEVEFETPGGERSTRFAINVVGFGMNGEVVRRVNSSSKRLGGRVTFLAATLRSLAHYVPPETTVEWVDERGGQGTWTGPLNAAFVANGSYCGGGMCVAPSAAIDDGFLDLVILPSMALPSAMRHLPRLYDGGMERVPGVVVQRVRSVSAHSNVPVRVDSDGEQPGNLPVQVRVRPHALFATLP